MNSIDIFPWNENFNTNIPIIDEQHQKLVHILNLLASHVAHDTDLPSLNTIFDELTSYTVYHFETEEKVWGEHLSEDMIGGHIEVHRSFVSTISTLKNEMNTHSSSSIVEEVLSFLTSWLASHILETDRYMAMVVLAKQEGMLFDQARSYATEKMNGTMRVLIDIILSTYRSHVTNTVHLMREIAEHKQLSGKLSASYLAQQESLARINSLINSALDAVISMDEEGRVIDWNPQAEKTFGYSKEQAMGQDLGSLIVPEQHRKTQRQFMEQYIKTGQQNILGRRIEIQALRAGGDEFPVELTISTLQQNKKHTFSAYIRDLSDRKRAEETIYDLAFLDPLTKLPNRRLLNDRLHQLLLSVTRKKQCGAILAIDLDDFTIINDTQGHGKGDLLLQEVARRLQSAVHSDDTVARLGGDEFVVVLNSLEENQEQAAIRVQQVAERIRDALTAPIDLQGYEHHGSASIGIILFRDQEKSVSELMKLADSALHQAQKTGRNSINFFDPATQSALETRAIMGGWMHKANSDQYRLYYQIQVDSLGKPTGVEALIRWLHPEKGMISPAEFIPLAEDSGLIIPIGAWVLETACAQLKAWSVDNKTKHLQISVNVSEKQFRQQKFVDHVLSILAKTGANPEKLKLELTESILAVDVEDIIRKMEALRAEGIKFSLDDFGTGFSSLSYLKKLPLSQLKIDQSFVRDALTDPNDAAIVRTVIALGQSMGMEVIAEGVETEEQRNFLSIHGCQYFQGYLFGKPVPIEQLSYS